MDIKKKLDHDSRYKAISDSVLREDYFYEYIKMLKDERKKEKSKKAKKSEKKDKKKKSKDKDRSRDDKVIEIEDDPMEKTEDVKKSDKKSDEEKPMEVEESKNGDGQSNKSNDEMDIDK